MLRDHPVASYIIQPEKVRGPYDPSLPVRRNAVVCCPLVDSLGVCADLLRQSLAGRPSVDQIADGGLFIHAPTVMDVSSIVKVVETSSIGFFSGGAKNSAMDESPHRDPTAPQIVARRLAAVREALGMSRAEFSDMIGVDRSSYTKIENGMKPILPPLASRIWELYGIDLNFIYLGQVGGAAVQAIQQGHEPPERPDRIELVNADPRCAIYCQK